MNWKKKEEAFVRIRCVLKNTLENTTQKGNENFELNREQNQIVVCMGNKFKNIHFSNVSRLGNGKTEDLRLRPDRMSNSNSSKVAPLPNKTLIHVSTLLASRLVYYKYFSFFHTTHTSATMRRSKRCPCRAFYFASTAVSCLIFLLTLVRAQKFFG